MARKFQLFGGFLLTVCGTAWAGIIPGPPDPDIAMDAGSFSSAIGVGVQFAPINGGGIFGFFNGLGGVITSLTLQTNALPGLNADQVATFQCRQPTSFFHNCTISYTGATGLLSVNFSGTDPLDGDEDTDPEIFEFEGIPPIPAGCTDSESEFCQSKGHFGINLNDGDIFTPPGQGSGGWSVANSPTLFAQDPIFTVTDIQLAPEPAPFALLAVPLLLLASRFRKRNRV
jgi:hypothetical protein